MFLHFPGKLVGVDAHIDPAERTILTEISGKFVTSQRDDVPRVYLRTPNVTGSEKFLR